MYSKNKERKQIGREFRGIKDEKAINAFIRNGGIIRGGKGNHVKYQNA